MKVQLLSGATATNGAGSMAVGSITTVAVANLVDGETFTLDDGVTSSVFEFDKTGNGVTGGRVAVDVSGDTTAGDVRDTVIAAVNGSGLTIAASIAGTAKAGLKNAVVGTVGNTTSGDTVDDVGFVVTNMAGGIAGVVLRSAVAGVEIGDKAELVVASTAGSGTMTATIRLWGYSAVAQDWFPLGVGTASGKGVINGGSALEETGADAIAHIENIDGLENLERIHAEIVSIGGTATAISAWLVARR